jgi:creatinine amidohydrolase
MLDEIPWTEAAERAAAGAIALLPIGSVEAHGPHLPLGTDTFLSIELARRAAEAIVAGGDDAVIAPAIPYAITEYAGGFAGTLSIGHETAVSLVTDVCSALISKGWRRVCLVNSHLEPAHVASLTAACARVEERTGHRVAFPDQTSRRWARTLTDEYKRGACHAGSYETSLLLAARPALVRDEARRDLPPLPIDLARAMKDGVRTFEEAGAHDAYFGDPASATREEGDGIYALLVMMILTTIDETWPKGATT